MILEELSASKRVVKEKLQLNCTECDCIVSANWNIG
jgi:hypothetical protein